MRKRSNEAFKQNVVNEGVIAKCAAYAAREHGDARRALDLLRVAGELAERSSNNKIEVEHIDLANEKIEKDKILAFKIIDDKLESSGENDTIFQYGFYLFYTLIKRNYNFAIEGEIKHELIIPSVTMNITDARNIITDVNTRARMITEGEKYAKLFLKYKSKNN